jgi:hypothetical protein
VYSWWHFLPHFHAVLYNAINSLLLALSASSMRVSPIAMVWHLVPSCRHLCVHTRSVKPAGMKTFGLAILTEKSRDIRYMFFSFSELKWSFANFFALPINCFVNQEIARNIIEHHQTPVVLPINHLLHDLTDISNQLTSNKERLQVKNVTV